MSHFHEMADLGHRNAANPHNGLEGLAAKMLRRKKKMPGKAGHSE